MTDRLTIDMFHLRSQHGYYTGDLEVSSPRNHTRAVRQISFTVWPYAPEKVEMSLWGVMGGWLARLTFNKAEALDKICAKWLQKRGHLVPCSDDGHPWMTSFELNNILEEVEWE